MPNDTIINIPEHINISIGIPGQKGDPGSKGKAFTYEDFTADQLEALKGAKGDPGEKGDPFRYEDFTPEQLAALKGEKGDPGAKGEDGAKGDTPTVPNTVHFLKENFIYLKDDNLDTVLLTALKEVNRSANFILSYEDIKAQYPFTVDPFNDGDENITVHGYNHFKVQIGNEEAVEILNNMAIVPVPKNTGDFINVKYINYLGEVVESKTIEKAKEDDTPAVVYQDATSPSMILSVKGTRAVLEFIPNGRNGLRSYTLKPLQNKVKRLVIDLTNSDRINDYVDLPFVPERIEILNYKRNGLNLSFNGSYNGVTKVVSKKSILNYNLNNNGEYEVSNLNGKSFVFSDSTIYIGDAL